MSDAQKITPFLWFDGKAVEAASYYVATFRNAKILSPESLVAGEPADDEDVMMVKFEIEGLEFIALNGGPMYRFTPATSFFIDCETQAEIDALTDRLTADGGEQLRCGWVTDKFGVTWQIVPSILGELMDSDDDGKTAAVRNEMFTMMRLDIARLQAAYDRA